jgi:hypothetical protein
VRIAVPGLAALLIACASNHASVAISDAGTDALDAPQLNYYAQPYDAPPLEPPSVGDASSAYDWPDLQGNGDPNKTPSAR